MVLVSSVSFNLKISYLLLIMELQKNNKIYPFIDSLVDALFTDEINNIIDSENVKFDKKTFIMFICMYFSTRLYAKKCSKETIKEFMTDIIRNPVKRQQCILLFNNFEKILKIEN